MSRLAGKVALISGGARGMGASHARLFVENGAQVVVGDLLDEDGEKLAAELGDAARYIHLDVTQEDQWQQAVAFAESEFGRLDILVNNAGISHITPLAETTLESWNLILGVNLTGTFLGMKSAAEALKRSGKGSIVNISSIAGIGGQPQIYGYTASKFGVRGITKDAAAELGEFNVRVNSVHPGVIDTPMTEGLPDVTSTTPLQRNGKPIELSNLVLFLASDESSFSTGSEFVADGGQIAVM